MEYIPIVILSVICGYYSYNLRRANEVIHAQEKLIENQNKLQEVHLENIRVLEILVVSLQQRGHR